VPFLLRTGKRLARRDTRVVMIFREAPLRLFEGDGGERPEANRLTLRIQPNDGISLDFVVKRPGPDLIAHPVRMDFGFASSFPAARAEAYERLLHDALMGDHTLFIRSDEVDASWAIVDPVLASPPPVTFYEAGSWDPCRRRLRPSLRQHQRQRHAQRGPCRSGRPASAERHHHTERQGVAGGHPQDLVGGGASACLLQR
jgi:glucose-6-phosphate 1-dehydrogenase